MTIQEVIKIGEPFYRTKSTYYFFKRNEITGVKQIKQIMKSGKKEIESFADFSLNDILSCGWKIKNSDSQLNAQPESNTGTSTSYFARPKTIEELKEEFEGKFYLWKESTFEGNESFTTCNEDVWEWIEEKISEERGRATKCL